MGLENHERDESIEQIELNKLQQIAGHLLDIMRGNAELSKNLISGMKNYHGFAKSRFPPSVMEELGTKLSFEAENVQAELVKVGKDLQNEVHLHRKAHAHCIILGEEENLENPVYAYSYLNDRWFAIRAGEVVSIEPGVAHGFTALLGKAFYFLSVQSPPIEGTSDDYCTVIPKQKIIEKDGEILIIPVENTIETNIDSEQAE